MFSAPRNHPESQVHWGLSKNSAQLKSTVDGWWLYRETVPWIRIESLQTKIAVNFAMPIKMIFQDL